MSTKAEYFVVNEIIKHPGRTLAVAAALALAGCGGETRTVTVTETVAPPTATQPAKDFTPPPSVDERPIMSEGDCIENWWTDEDGKRQPFVKDREEPTLILDGRCNTPLDETYVGIYEKPVQKKGAGVRVDNGTEVWVRCYTEGQDVYDLRGPELSGSDVWLKVVAPDRITGFVPETNIGYVDESELTQC